MNELKCVNIYNADGKILTDNTIKKIKKIIAQNNDGKITLVVEGGSIKTYKAH